MRLVSPGSEQAPRGGIDLGGTKIQTAVVDADNQVLGRRGTRPPPGRARGRRRRDRRRRCARRPSRPASRPRDLGRSRHRLTRRRRRVDRRRLGRQEPPRLDRLLSRSASASPQISACRSRSATTSRSRSKAEFELGAGKEFDTILGVWWGTGVGGGLILDGKPWLGRGAAAEIGHVVVKMGGARCTCGRQGLHGGLRGPHGDGDQGAQGGQARGQDRPLQDHGGARP